MTNQPFNWQCPYCSRHTTISAERCSIEYHSFDLNSKHGAQYLQTVVVSCPNDECKELTITAARGGYRNARIGPERFAATETWRLRPRSSARVFPEFIPEALRTDYEEACDIRDRSPKASATLARRCLQGMVRDFWKVTPGRLFDEIAAIKNQVDPLTWDAIDAVRKIGNIGAHMEKDVSLIIEVEPEEAQLLIGLIETLFDEWYVAAEARKKRMSAITAAAQLKATAQLGIANNSGTSGASP